MSLAGYLARWRGRAVQPPTPYARTVPFRQLFVEAWAELRDRLAARTAPGLLVVAIDQSLGRCVSAAVLPAAVDTPAVAIIGRHRGCDVIVDDPCAADRHLAIVLEPLRAEASSFVLTTHVLDLKSGAGFLDEQGRALDAVIASGSSFFAIGRHALFILTTGDDLERLLDPEEAWDCIPERVYQEERRGTGRGRVLENVDAGIGRTTGNAKRPSVVRTVLGPSRATVSLVAPDERAIGTIDVVARHGTSEVPQRIIAGENSLNRGILVGRHEACDTHGVSGMRHPQISRVHLLLLRIHESIYALDARSLNGTYELVPASGAIRRSAVRLSASTDLMLGADIARLSWRSV